MRNRFFYWHNELEKLIGKRISVKAMAIDYLGVEHTQYGRLEKSGKLPESTTYLFKVWLSLRKHFPGINMQDLIEYTSSDTSE